MFEAGCNTSVGPSYGAGATVRGAARPNPAQAPAAAPPTREREAPSAAATEPKADRAAKRSGKDAFLVKDKDSY